ncbi:hypothetical protein CFAM422_013157 [Trichoderma lentiforme]|uniref:Uncharacterized protein n=1 Tax=Trichoderma lentiforme TaxID=1567552 RepID=A0A9P4X2M0_9HYPO|nr:hypothetical protein CFAM422_013157 [Trichoderma lentiforme]
MAYERSGSIQALSSTCNSPSYRSISPRHQPPIEAHSSSYDDDDGIDQELSTSSNAAGSSMRESQPMDADHFVIRAYKAIVNVMNLRWSLTGLQNQASLLAMAKGDHLDNPGARLFALRSKLRNEQHMAIAIDRVAAVLLVDMRDDLGGSYDGVREKGFRTAIVGNKMLAEQWKKTHKEVVEEIRAAITYNFAEQIISPGINLLLGSRSQDVWEKRFSRKKVEVLHRLLKQTEEGRIVLSRAKDLDDAVITIKCILSIHIGYKWRCAKYASLNTQESSETLFKKLQGQLSTRTTDMRQLESTLYSTLDKSRPKIGQITEESLDSFVHTSIPTPNSSVFTEKRRGSVLSGHDHPSKKRRCSLGSTSNASHIIDGLPLAVRPIADQDQYDRRALSTDRVDQSLNLISQSSPEDHCMLDSAEEDTLQSGLENTEEMDREEDRMELQTQLASENQNPENSLSYQYGEQWGITEDVSTLDDILSLSW